MTPLSPGDIPIRQAGITPLYLGEMAIRLQVNGQVYLEEWTMKRQDEELQRLVDRKIMLMQIL